MKELAHLPEKIQNKLKNFVEELKNLYSDRLVSVILYGSAAGEDFVPGRSDINTIVILKRVDFDSLQKYQARQKKFAKLGIVAPLFLEPEYIQNSADSFPIEFLEIKSQNQVLQGEDFFSGLEIHPTNLRLQCEQEIKGKLIRLRQHFLESDNSLEKLTRLLSSSLSSFLPVFRNLLWLKNKNQIRSLPEVLNQMEKELGFSSEPLRKVWSLKKREQKLSGRELQKLFAEYLDLVQKLALKVDKI